MGVWWADRNDCLNVYDSIIVYRPPLPHFSLLSHSLPKPASPFTTNKDNLCLWLYVHAQKINQHFCTSFSPNHQENWTGFLFFTSLSSPHWPAMRGGDLTCWHELHMLWEYRVRHSSRLWILYGLTRSYIHRLDWPRFTQLHSANLFSMSGSCAW